MTLFGAPAAAADLFSRETFSGVLVAGPIAASGERGWLDRGLGKLRQGGDAPSVTGDLIVAWRPSFSERLGGLITVQAQSQADPGVGVGEAYLVLRPDLSSALRISGRAGLFFPPISLEHDGSEWTLVHTLSASAINSWVAEEVKTVGVEGKVRGGIGGLPVTLTVAGFKGNDTSGALVTYRGWALHDLRSSLGGQFPLPPLSPLFAGKQAPNTASIDEIDNRWGGYGRLDLEPSSTLLLSGFVYDNNGDPTAVRNGQYAWRTRFAQLAARWRVANGVDVVGQVMTGETTMGRLQAGQRQASVGFDSAFLLVTKPMGEASVAGRIDYFSVSDRTFKAVDNNAEAGWAATVAWRQPLAARSDILVEGLATRNDRPDRRRLGDRSWQTQVQLRTALRFEF